MAIKVFVEFQIKPGRRDEFVSLVRGITVSMGSVPGFLGSTTYEVVGDPNGMAEIAEWESPEAREAVMAQFMQSDALAPFMDLLAAPFRATIVRPLP
jgi:quinol monooxygenase YgiN